MSEYIHVPVLLKEAIELLNVEKDKTYIDATLGGGGYSKTILQKNGPKGKLLATDLDKDSIDNFKNSEVYKKNSKRIVLVHGNYRNIDKYVVEHKTENPNGIVADLGMSSYQLDGSSRGISFQKRELLDMRFDQTGKLPTASYLLNNSSESEITEWLAKYGEEPAARKIANNIIKERSSNSLKTTEDLVEIIKKSLPGNLKHKWDSAARRVFQALRIAVNHELASLEEFLPKAFDILSPGGRLVIVSFHSLEDRIVKHFFQGLAKGCVCPPDFPTCVCGKNPKAKILTKKIVTPSDEEVRLNSRSKPAKLRAIEKY